MTVLLRERVFARDRFSTISLAKPMSFYWIYERPNILRTATQQWFAAGTKSHEGLTTPTRKTAKLAEKVLNDSQQRFNNLRD